MCGCGAKRSQARASVPRLSRQLGLEGFSSFREGGFDVRMAGLFGQDEELATKSDGTGMKRGCGQSVVRGCVLQRSLERPHPTETLKLCYRVAEAR